MPCRNRRTAVVSTAIALVCIATAFIVPARAQDAAAPAPAAVAPALDCQKPGDFPPLDRASPEAARFQKKMEEYKNCIVNYTRINGAKANELAAQSRAYSDAANKAIDDYNAYVGQINVKVQDQKK